MRLVLLITMTCLIASCSKKEVNSLKSEVRNLKELNNRLENRIEEFEYLINDLNSRVDDNAYDIYELSCDINYLESDLENHSRDESAHHYHY